MSIKVLDDFTGLSAAQDIGGTTPDTTNTPGGTWNQSGANTIEGDGSGSCTWAAANDQAWILFTGANQDITVLFNAGGADNRISIEARRDNGSAGAESCYSFNFRTGDTGGKLNMYKTISGSPTLIGTTAFTISNTTDYNVEIKVNGTSIQGYIDSVLKLDITDSAITTGDYAGFVGNLRTSAAGLFKSFTASATTNYLTNKLSLLGVGI